MAYDKKFKQVVINHRAKGQTLQETATLFGIGTTTIKTWEAKYKSGQSLDAKTRVRKPKKIPPEKLREYVSAHPDDYLIEIAAVFHCSESAVRKALKRLGITRKKRR